MPTFIVKDPKTEVGLADFIICLRVFDMPIPNVPARILVCRECLERVWLADSSPQDRPCVCFQCAEPLIAESGEEPMIAITEGQATAAADHISSIKLNQLLTAHVKKKGN